MLSPSPSHALELGLGERHAGLGLFVLEVADGVLGRAGVECSRPLYEKHVAGVGESHGAVLDAAWDADHLAGGEVDVVSLAVLHAHLAVDDEEHFVLVRVVVPDELALEAGQLDLRVIDVKGHVRVPGFGDGGERVMEVDLARDGGCRGGGGGGGEGGGNAARREAVRGDTGPAANVESRARKEHDGDPG